MLIVIDLSAVQVHLDEPDEFTRFSVALRGAGDLPSVLATSGLGRLRDDGQHVVVDPAALRALAAPTAGPGWDDGFAAMRDYAATKGWVEDDGGVVAHIERQS